MDKDGTPSVIDIMTRADSQQKIGEIRRVLCKKCPFVPDCYWVIVIISLKECSPLHLTNSNKTEKKPLPNKINITRQDETGTKKVRNKGI